MAGHSKFKNIMHRKGAQDKKRSAMFSKLSREITVAAKMGMPDPDMNPRLRLAVNAAKAQSMPKDNIQRAIDKASKGDGENYEEVRYEGYGPGGVALIVEALTDNRNRTATNVRTAFAKNGGNLGASGAVSHGFDRMGLITYPASAGDADKVLEAAIDPATVPPRTLLVRQQHQGAVPVRARGEPRHREAGERGEGAGDREDAVGIEQGACSHGDLE